MCEVRIGGPVILRLAYLTLSFLYAAKVSAWAQATQALDCVGRTNDTSLTPQSGPDVWDKVGYVCNYQNQFTEFCVDTQGTFKIRRAIGNGLSEVDGIESPTADSQGNLQNPSALIADGLVSKVAKIAFEFGTGGREPGVITVMLNGKAITQLTVIAGGFTGQSCVDVPIEYFRFAHRTPRGALIPGRNTMAFKMNRKNNGGPPVGEGVGTFVSTMAINFKALAPIMLVHGIQDNGDAFQGVEGGSGRFSAFIQPLAAVRAGFRVVRHNSISIEDGARVLPGALQASNLFGAYEMHAVCWSKGGLWMRAAIAQTALPLRTFTTLDTPHSGALPAFGIVSSLSILSAIPLSLTSFEAQDLSPLRVALSSRNWSSDPHSYPIPNSYPLSNSYSTSAYYSVQSNADTNLDGKIQNLEGDGFLGQTFTTQTDSLFLNLLYRVSGF